MEIPVSDCIKVICRCDLKQGLIVERCLSYDEKPLLLFQKLKDAKKNPVFMLKHIRDIRSPIAVAQQKQAARAKEKEKRKRKEEGDKRKREIKKEGTQRTDG